MGLEYQDDGLFLADGGNLKAILALAEGKRAGFSEHVVLKVEYWMVNEFHLDEAHSSDPRAS